MPALMPMLPYFCCIISNISMAEFQLIGEHKVEIQYRVQTHAFKDVYNGDWTASTALGTKKRKKLSFETFTDCNEARKRVQWVDDLNCEVIAKPLFLNESNELTVAVYDEPIYENLHTWNQRQDISVWEYTFDKNQNIKRCIGLGGDFIKVCKGVLRGLLYIHSKQKYHGNLLGGITISKDNEVKLIGHTVCQDLETGIRKDLIHFKKFVNSVVKAHKTKGNVPKPMVLKLFYELWRIFVKNPVPSLSPLRYFFIYNNPLFWSGSERYYFINKLWELRSRNPALFKKMCVLKGKWISMVDWSKSVPKRTGLWKVLRFGGGLKRYKKPGTVLTYLRNTFAHYQTKRYSFTDMSAIEDLLYRTLPHACPKLFFWLAMDVFPCNKAATQFKCDIVSFLKKEPLTFHIQ